MQPSDGRIEIGKSGGNAGYPTAAMLSSLNPLEDRNERDVDGFNGVRRRDPRDIKDRLLGLVDEVLNVARISVAFGGIPLAGEDQLPQPPLLPNRVRVRLYVRDGRRRIAQECKVLSPHLLHGARHAPAATPATTTASMAEPPRTPRISYTASNTFR